MNNEPAKLMPPGEVSPSDSLLSESWRRAWQALDCAGDAGNLPQQIAQRYREPHRHYHSLAHLSACLGQLAPVLPLAEHPGELEIALWFHDAIYELGRDDNEQRSADWARQSLLEAAASPEAADRVHALVMATRHAVLPQGTDQCWLIDIDLSILGAPGPVFDRYERQVREEYRAVPQDRYRQGRRAILQGFLARPAIYSTPYFQTRLEQQARLNLARSIAALGSDDA